MREVSVPMWIFLAAAESISVHSFLAQNSSADSLSYTDLLATIVDQLA